MQPVRSFGVLFVALAMAGCGESDPAVGPESATDAALQSSRSNRVVAQVSGRADHTRTVGDVTALTLFRFHMQQKADGRTSGRYYYNFQAAGFAVRGPVTCLTINGNQAWIGGTVESIDSPDPEDQSLVGVDMWWRSVDNGHGRHAAPDSTTGLGFAFAGSTITAESWCNDQPAVLVMREVERGNIKVRSR